MNISLLTDEINRTIRGADRPEFTLMQRYETSTDHQKTEFILAMIGGLVMQDRILQTLQARANLEKSDGALINEDTKAGISIKGD